ncbi:MAG: acetate/propionate family kinase [Gammaproteobacteria bacterium]|nr:acetate/propionate family kinase [Gammaproteobacteria bacterium]
MNQAEKNLLSINGGSSSIKFALYGMGETLQCSLSGKIERIGLSGTRLSYKHVLNGQQGEQFLDKLDHTSAVNFLLDWLAQQPGFDQVVAVGHRVVHGMKYTHPETVSPALLDELHRISDYDPDHLPGEIELIETFSRRYPELTQVACFDTAFHVSMPRVAKLLPVPRRFDAMGVQRYGFHGLSYAYLMQELTRLDEPSANQGRVILAHLGNGASLVAVRDGRSIDTSMGFTPSSGVPMGTRSGDLDPGVAWYMMQSEQLSPDQFKHLINHQSGLLGVSETSSDMRDLTHHESDDERAAEAVELFCYQVKKYIGAYAAVLNGLDILVFTGGIGEHHGGVRARICENLEYLGITLDKQCNEQNAGVISAQGSRVWVRVIATDEELMIAESVRDILERE